MKGWVYIITNRCMPGLVKIGYTMKDPEIRASELSGTGVPTPYIVEYEVIIEEPRDLEQAVHMHLSQFREGKEWFRLSTEKAIAGIKKVADNNISLENYKHADRQKAEIIARQEREKEEQQKSRNRQIEAQKKYLDTLYAEKIKLQKAKDSELSALIKTGFVDYWINYVLITTGITIILALFGANYDGVGIWVISGIMSFFVAPLVNEWLQKNEMNKPRYRELEQNYNKCIAIKDNQIKYVGTNHHGTLEQIRDKKRSNIRSSETCEICERKFKLSYITRNKGIQVCVHCDGTFIETSSGKS